MSIQGLRKFSGWLGALACASLLAACGGGGGSPGTNFNGQQPSKASSIVLTASAGTIASSGQDGTEVTLTAIVKDSNNNVLPNETVSFKSSSGNISNSNRTTDSNGQVVEKLNVKGDSSLRDITITASAGGATSNTVTVKVVSATQTLTLTTDSGTLQSAGASGSEVTVTALVKDSNNTVMSGVKVDLSADAGSLTAGTRLTDANGRVTEKLSTGGDASSRQIKVTASIAGLAPVSTTVAVSGTRLTVNSNSAVNLGATTDVTVKLVDSAGNALSGKTVTFSAARNQVTVKGGGSAVTDAAGQLILSYSGSSSGSDVITVKSMGETASASIAVGSSSFNVAVVDGSDAALNAVDINVCQRVLVRSLGSTVLTGTATVSSSRGIVYSDASCTSALNSGVPFVAGNATAYLRATSPGVATLNATASSTGSTAQGVVEFVAPLLPSSTVTVQADPAVLAANIPGSTSQQTTIRAVVRDGTAQNNLVKNAVVSFSIVSDPSGGTLTQPSVVTTGADGAASISYIAGTSSTAADGVVIRAQVQGVAATGTATLTVAGKSLFISAGTGNSVATPDSTTYRMDYAVFVSDASGNAVPGVKVTAAVRPRYYYKGVMVFVGTDGPWVPQASYACPNEDVDGNGLLGGGEDVNNNGRLDPGIPINVTSTGTTDASGKATVSLTYPRDRAKWMSVDLTIRGQAAGSEAVYVAYIPRLLGAADDYRDKAITPPGATSPFGAFVTAPSGVLGDCANPN
jgi:hypothetical protein